mgnify:CR=1 FL=1
MRLLQTALCSVFFLVGCAAPSGDQSGLTLRLIHINDTHSQFDASPASVAGLGAVGVLCVQHVEPRRYEEVEIEALQTTAMVLSELIANAELVDEEEARGLTQEQTGPQTLAGLTLVKMLVTGLVLALLAGTIVKIKLFGGPQ